MYSFLLEHRDISGPINCTSPEPVRNREMTTILGQVLGKPTFMPAVPGFVIRLVMGEFGSVLLKGQRVLPRRLLKKGFSFQFPSLKDALEEITAGGG
jgi:NAD dependent epimerase/dehydratase family enzyme